MKLADANINASLPGMTKKLSLPSLLLILLVSTAISLQTFYYNFPGKENITSFMLILITKLIDSLYYFILFPVAYYLLKDKNRLSAKTLLPVYVLISFAFIFFHQAVSYFSKLILLNGYYNMSLVEHLTGNTLIWLDIVIFISFLVGLNLIENIYMEKEIQLKHSTLEMQLVKSKLHQLRGSIHPHFVFRILDKITLLISKKKNKEANQVLSSLSNFLRATIYDNQNDEISLKEELHYLKLYLEVENISRTGKIEIEESVDEKLLNCSVPNFFLQPLIENLVECSDVNTSSVYIMLYAFEENNSLQIIISSNAQLNVEQLTKGRSIDLTKERLNRMYNNNHSFKLVEHNSAGMEITISIPLSITESIQGDT